MLVCFEGINMTGKTSLATLVKDALEDKGLEVVMFRYPKKTPDLMLPREELGARFLAEMIRDVPEIERLRASSYVILSRWFYSTLAYQEMPADTIRRHGFSVPDIVFLLDADPSDLADRLPDDEKDLYEGDTEFQKTVRSRYHELMESRLFGARWVVIDALVPITEKLEVVLREMGVEK